MKIVLAPEVAINLESLVSQVGRQEFSGIGFVEVIDGDHRHGQNTSRHGICQIGSVRKRAHPG